MAEEQQGSYYRVEVIASQTKQGKEEIYDFIENLLAGEQV